MKRKRKSFNVLDFSLVICTVLFFSFVVLLMIPQREEGSVGTQTLKQTFTTVSEEKQTLNGVIQTDGEIRAVWIASVGNLNFPSKPGLSREKLEKEIDDILSFCNDKGLNTVFFQIRPSSDALYYSDIFPTSYYLCEKQGDELPDGFDPFLYLIRQAHARNIAVFAWINPLRVSTTDDYSALSGDNPAVLHPEWCVSYNGGIYYNPGEVGVRELVAESLSEVVSNYECDGVIFDDYFYPYPQKDEVYDDSLQYAKYGYGSLLSDWRRENVNALVKLCYETVKNINGNCLFGVSPFGIWQNDNGKNAGSDTRGLSAYDAIYCDALAWISGGYVDFLAPQIYWSFDNSIAPFATLCDWWEGQLQGSNTKLIVSHAAYKAEEWSNSFELANQIEYSREKSTYIGSAIYGYATLQTNSSVVETLGTVY